MHYSTLVYAACLHSTILIPGHVHDFLLLGCETRFSNRQLVRETGAGLPNWPPALFFKPAAVGLVTVTVIIRCNVLPSPITPITIFAGVSFRDHHRFLGLLQLPEARALSAGMT